MNYFVNSNQSPESFRLWVGEEGLKVYEEIHQNRDNRNLHVAFLPGVFYGTFMIMPALIPKLPAWLIVFTIMLSYTIFYASFDIEGAIYAFFFTLPSATMALHSHSNGKNSVYRNFKVGLIYLIVSLGIQEVFGHFYLEKIPSRLTLSYVTNAIIYSPLFYAKNIVTMIPAVIMNTGCLLFFSLILYIFID